MILILTVAISWQPTPARAVESKITVGGLTLQKTDLTGNPLEGASFQILRPVRDGELGNRDVEKKLVAVEGENRIMVPESFWLSREMTGRKYVEMVTDREGKVSVYGLPYGTYYLQEILAPEGYSRIVEPIRVTIHKYSHLTAEDQVYDDKDVLIDNTLHIVNVRYALPDTGNLGTVSLAAAGTGIVFSAAALILLNSRRRQ